MKDYDLDDYVKVRRKKDVNDITIGNKVASTNLGAVSEFINSNRSNRDIFGATLVFSRLIIS